MNSLELLKAYYKGEHHEFNGDVKEEVKKQNEQSLAPFLFYVYGNKFINQYLGATLIQEKFFKLQDKITKLFNDNNIDHLYLKGSVVSKFYPDTALRTRGDIDLLVRKDDYDKANKVLVDSGFKSIGVSAHHKEYEINGCDVEVHYKLFSESDKIHSMFDTPFDHTIASDNNLKNLNINYHYLYLLAHFNKHLKVGEGLRYLLDFYYVAKKNDLDFEYIYKELEKLKLTRLHDSIVNCIYEITNEWICEVEKIDVTELLDFMLESGIHSQSNDIMQTTKAAIYGNKFKRIFCTIFMIKYDTKYHLYPKLSKHWFLYPIMLLKHICYLIKNKRKEFKDTIKSSKKINQYVKELYDNYGIRN